jgi:hypothetical protein
MAVNCEQVWHEIPNYLENDVDPSLRAAWKRTPGSVGDVGPCSKTPET